ncbi:MAG: class I SAM-dependent methyltransferase [Chitinophagaceae bacterium]
MSETITYTQCPLCRSADISAVLTAKDFTVSNEKFEIWQCKNCTLRFTQNIPAASAIGKYYQSSEYISHSDSKKGFINWLYHFVRNFTLQSKKKLVEKSIKKTNGNLLDIGAGTGSFVYVMQKENWNVTGLEPDETARKNAFENYRLQLQTMESLHQLSYENFDVITLWHVLEHVHDLHNYLEIFKRILKRDGTLIIAVPNYTSLDAKIYKEYWAAYDVPRHLYHFSPQSMQTILQQHLFQIKNYKPMWFDSFYVSMLSEKYRSGKNNLLKSVWNGLRSNLHAARDIKRCSSVIYIIQKIN